MLNLNHIICFSKSTIRVYSLFKIQVPYDGDEMSDFFIKCTCCKKIVSCQISGAKQDFFTRKEILPVFIKDAVFCHIGITWMIATKEKNNFSVSEQYE